MLYAFPLRLPAHALLVFSCWAFSTYLWRFPVRRVQRSPRRPWGWATAFRRLPISLAALLVSAYAIMVCRAESAGGAARSLLLLNKTTQAESVARIAHRLLPEHGDFTFLYAITLWERSKDIATVLELLHRAQLTSTNTRIPIAKGLLLMKNRRNQEAYRVLEDIASFQAPLDGLHHARGLVEYLNENYEEAALQLEAEVRQYPRNYEAHLYLAACYRILQKTALAIETLQRALSIKPGGLDAHIQLSEIYEQTRDYEEAERELQQAVDVAADLGDFETATELTVRLRQLRLEGGLN